MRTLRVAKGRVGKRALAEAVRVLAEGGVVAFPTETAYGLAADPANPVAMRKVYAIKGRERGKPLPLVAASAAQVRAHAALGPLSRRLARAHWPGPLTVIAAARTPELRKLSSDGTVAVRVPGSAWARALPDALGRPVTSTSANLSGTPSCYSGAAVLRAFRGRKAVPDLLLDAGPLRRRAPSTIVRENDGKMEVLRKGPVRTESGK